MVVLPLLALVLATRLFVDAPAAVALGLAGAPLLGALGAQLARGVGRGGAASRAAVLVALTLALSSCAWGLTPGVLAELFGWCAFGFAALHWRWAGWPAVVGLTAALLALSAVGLLPGIGPGALGWTQPGWASALWQVSPLVRAWEAAGIDVARHPAFYEVAGSDGFPAGPVDAPLAIPVLGVLVFALAARVQGPLRGADA